MNYPILIEYYKSGADINKLLSVLMNNGLYSNPGNNFNQAVCIQLIENHEKRIKEDIDELKRNNEM